MDTPMSLAIPENPIADAKDALRAAGVVTGPDRYGNWFVPTGKTVAGWQPGETVEERVLVRNSGVLAGSPCYDMRWDWIAGGWVENVEGLGEGPVGEPLPSIY